MDSDDTSTTPPPPPSDARTTGLQLLGQIEAAEAREWSIRRKALIGAVCIVTVLVPVIYLYSTGDLKHQRDRLFPSKHHALMVNRAKRDVDPAALDFDAYINHSIPSVAPMETQALDDFNGVIGRNSQGDVIFIQVVHDKVLPEYRAYFDAVNRIHPQTPALAAIHMILIQSAKHKLNAFTLIAAGTGHTTDPAWQKSVSEDLALSDAANAQFRKSLDTFQQAHTMGGSSSGSSGKSR